MTTMLFTVQRNNHAGREGRTKGRMLMKTKEQREKDNTIVWILLVGYAALVIYFTLFCSFFGRYPHEYVTYNLIPFSEIRRFWDYRNQLGMSSVINLLGNVLIFLPLGMLFTVLLGRVRIKVLPATGLSFLFSFGVEIAQYLTKRGSFDVDDLILNTLGGAAGAVLCAAILRMKAKKVSK